MKKELPKRRNLIVKDMILRNGAGKHQDKRFKRQSNPKRQDWRDW